MQIHRILPPFTRLMEYRVPLLIALAMLTLCACTGPEKPAWLSINPNNWSNRAIRDEPIVLDVHGPVQIDVESFNGDVVLDANPELAQTTVIIVRETVHGHGREKEGLSTLDQITSSVEVVPGELGQAIRVRTQTTNAEAHYQRAHIYIKTPEIENIRVKTSNGRVWARHVRGWMDITTSEKDVRIMTNLALTQPVTIINRNGDIEFRVRGESHGIIDAITINGDAQVFAPFGQIVVKAASSKDTYKGVLNKGDNPIVLRTVNGDIYVAVVHNPELVQWNPIP